MDKPNETQDQDSAPSKSPVGRLVLNGVAVALCSGTIPGVALWTAVFWMSGVYSSRCLSTNGFAPCRESLHNIISDMLQANVVGVIAEGLFGMLFDSSGGVICGYLGTSLHIIGWLLMILPLRNARTSSDSFANHLMLPALHCINIGAAGLKWSLYNFMLQWSGRQGKVMYTKNFCTQAGFLVPVVALAVVFLQAPIIVIPILLICFGVFALGVLHLATPSEKEVQGLSEDLLAQEFPPEGESLWDLIEDDEWMAKLKKRAIDLWQPEFFNELWEKFVSGFRQLNQPFDLETYGPSRCPWLVRQQYRVHHCFLVLLVGVNSAFCIISQTVAVGYVLPPGSLPIPSFLTGLLLAFYVSFVYFIIGSFIPPLVARIQDQKPPKALKKLCWLNVGGLLVAFVGATFRMWSTQMVMFAITAYVQATLPYLLSIHVYAYAPINMIGPTAAALAAPIVVVYLLVWWIIMARLESLTAFPFDEHACDMDVASVAPVVLVSFFFALFYAIIFSVRGNPKVPFLLPEEEESRCLAYGCKSLQEVASVMGFEGKKVVDPVVCLFYNTTEEQNTLVCTMIAENMKETMEQLPKGNLRNGINKGFIWQSNVEPEIYRSKLGYGLIVHPELFRFGAPRKKVDDDGKKKKKKKKRKNKDFNLRVVDIVSLRMVWAHGEWDKTPLILVETLETQPDGSTRPILQYPNLKMYNAESVPSATDRLLEECGGWDELSLNVNYSAPSLHKETFESPSYPGMVTVYQRHIVETDIHEQPHEMIERLAGIGLPDGTPFERQASRSGNVVLRLEWMTEEAIQKRDPKFVLKGAETTPASQLGRRKTMSMVMLDNNKQEDASKETNEPERLPSSIAAPLKALVQNCNTRPFTKHLVRLIRNGDKAALEEWIQGEEREHITHAFKDMHVWTGPDASGLFTQFFGLIPWSRLAAMSTESKSVKSFVLDLLTTDLKKTQAELDDVIEFERQVWAGELKVNSADPKEEHLPKDSIVARRKARVIRMYQERKDETS